MNADKEMDFHHTNNHQPPYRQAAQETGRLSIHEPQQAAEPGTLKAHRGRSTDSYKTLFRRRQPDQRGKKGPQSTPW